MEHTFKQNDNKNINRSQSTFKKPFTTFKEALNEEDLAILLNIQKNYNKHRRRKRIKKEKRKMKLRKEN